MTSGSSTIRSTGSSRRSASINTGDHLFQVGSGDVQGTGEAPSNVAVSRTAFNGDTLHLCATVVEQMFRQPGTRMPEKAVGWTIWCTRHPSRSWSGCATARPWVPVSYTHL